MVQLRGVSGHLGKMRQIAAKQNSQNCLIPPLLIYVICLLRHAVFGVFLWSFNQSTWFLGVIPIWCRTIPWCSALEEVLI